jgi:hypothetical protein
MVEQASYQGFLMLHSGLLGYEVFAVFQKCEESFKWSVLLNSVNYELINWLDILEVVSYCCVFL